MTKFDEKMQKLNTLISEIARRSSINTEFQKEQLDIIDMFQDQERDIQALIMVINMPRQKKLNDVSDQIIQINYQLNNGLCTVNEYLGRMAEIATTTEHLDLAGLICPITGLQYPTEAETNEFMKGFES